MKRVRLGLVLGLVAGQACFCEDPTLNKEPEPDVEVTDDQNRMAGRDPPLIIEFGDVEIGQRASKVVKVKNVGRAPLAITRLGPVVDAMDPVCPISSAEFAYPPVGSSQGVELTENGERLIEVAYRPQDGGGDCAIMEVKTSDPDEPSVRVYFQARGSAARFCAQDAVLDFGQLTIGETRELTTQVSNCGIRPLNLTAVGLNASFPPFELVTQVTTPRTFNPGDTLDLTFRFAPTEQGRWGGLNATREPGVVLFTTTEVGVGSITLQGSALPPPRCLLTVAPNAINFGQVAVGTTGTRDVLLSNAGDAPCTVDTISRISGADTFSVTAGGAPPAVTVAPFGTATFTITFAPTGTDLQNAVFRVEATGNQATGSVEVTVEGNQPPPQGCAMVADPSFLNFGVVPTGSVTTRMITLRSIGTEDCSLRQVSITAGATDFSSGTNPNPLLGVMVPTGSSTSVAIQVRPTTPGPKSGRVRLRYKSADSIFGGTNIDLDVDLAANAQAPAVCVTPDPVDFGTVPAGTEVTRSVAIQSCGAAPLNIRGVYLGSGTSPAFSVPMAPGLPITLQPGEQVNVAIRYQPTDAAGDLGILVVGSDDPNQPTVNVRLLANAVGLCPPLMRCQPETLEFGNVEVGIGLTQTVVCRNFGTSSVTITSATASPAPPYAATVLLPVTLAPGQGVTVQVTLVPTTTGAIPGTLVVQSNACETMQTVQLNATGVPPVIPACDPPMSFSPAVEWEWTDSPVLGTFNQVWMTPVVINLNDDNNDGAINALDIPDVVFTSFRGEDFRLNPMDSRMGEPVPAVLRALSGNDGHELWAVAAEALRLQSEAQLAAGDLDGDNRPEIIGSKLVINPGVEDIPGGPKLRGRYVRGRLLAFNNDGSFKWESDEWQASENELEDGGGPAIADLDQDGFAEVIYRAHVFDHEGHLKWVGTGGQGSGGHGAMPFATDLTGDGRLEVVGGNTAYRGDGTILWQRSNVPDGMPAVVDFELDGTPEVVVHNGKVHILNGEDGTDAYPPITLPYPAEGCPPGGESEECKYVIPTNVAIADFDNDGKPEIAVANKNLLLVYEANGTELWRREISDQSGASGPAAFDFEGDGIIEVVYADEGNVLAFRGTDGTQIYSAGRSSRTIFEYAIIADVDNDGHANMVVPSNEPLLRTAKGVKMLSNTAGRWAASGRIWNQHAFHVTNVTENGTIPRQEQAHYRGGREKNSFRAQGGRCQ